MTFVVVESCIRCKYMDCVEVCPVDCFHEGPNFLVIDPDECIDCSLCEPECPVNAIYAEEDLPDEMQHFTPLNEELSQKWPVITEIGTPPEDAKDWDDVPNKLQYLDRGEPRSQQTTVSRPDLDRGERRSQQTTARPGGRGASDTR